VIVGSDMASKYIKVVGNFRRAVADAFVLIKMMKVEITLPKQNSEKHKTRQR
jgi:hypothetical protein